MLESAPVLGACLLDPMNDDIPGGGPQIGAALLDGAEGLDQLGGGRAGAYDADRPGADSAQHASFFGGAK